MKKKFLYVILVIILFIGYKCNFYEKFTDYGWYNAYDTWSENIMVADLIYYENSNDITYFLKALTPGMTVNENHMIENPTEITNTYISGNSYPTEEFMNYTSNLCMHRYIYHIISRLFSDNKLTLRVCHGINVILFILLMAFVLIWISEITSVITVIILSLMLSMISPIFYEHTANLYWAPWSLILPLSGSIFVVYLSKKRQNFQYKLCYIMVFVTCAVKQMLYFEFLSTVMICMIVPLFFYVVIEKWNYKQIIVLAVKIVCIAIMSFLTISAFKVFLLYKLTNGTLMSALESYFGPIVYRLVGSSNSSDMLISDSAAASLGSVLNIMFMKPCITIKGYIFLSQGFLILINMFIFVYSFFRRKEEQIMGISEISFYAWCFSILISVFAPLSWFILAKPHTYVHNDICAFIWCLPFMILALAFDIYLLILLGKKLKKTFMSKEIEQVKKCAWKNILCWGIMGVFIFISIYGILPLDVTYDHWLINGYVEQDVTQHYAGWLAYRQSEWAFPIGKIEGLGGTMATYTDSIPLVAIFFKLLSPILPETFQYFGIYILLCFILQAIASGLLLNLFSRDIIVTDLGVVLFCYSPIMIERAFRHSALASHWLIVSMIYLYFKARQEKSMSIWSCLIPVLCISIHPYYLPILFGLMFTSLIELAFVDRKTIIKSGIYLGGTLIATVLWGYIIGALGTSSGLGGGGYGYYSMNLNAIVNPTSCSGIVWSRFLKILPQTLGNYDGFNYWGIGVFILLGISVVFAIIKREVLFHFLKKNVFLILLSIIFFCFAISTLNGEILFEYPLPEKVLEFCSIFRASSRIFYPVFYFIVLLGVNGLDIKLNVYWKRVMLCCCVILQLVDISPALSIKHNYFNKQTIDAKYYSETFSGSKLWASVVSECSKIKMLNNVSDYKLAAFGEKYHLEPDVSVSSSHYSGGVDINLIYQNNIEEITDRKVDKKAVYVTSDVALVGYLAKMNRNINIYYDSGYYEIVSSYVELDGEIIDKVDFLGIKAANLTDENWTAGVSNFDNNKVILFNDSYFLHALTQNSTNIIAGDKTYTIINYKSDGTWLQVEVDTSALECSYPNVLYFE